MPWRPTPDAHVLLCSSIALHWQKDEKLLSFVFCRFGGERHVPLVKCDKGLKGTVCPFGDKGLKGTVCPLPLVTKKEFYLIRGAVHLRFFQMSRVSRVERAEDGGRTLGERGRLKQRVDFEKKRSDTLAVKLRQAKKREREAKTEMSKKVEQLVAKEPSHDLCAFELCRVIKKEHALASNLSKRLKLEVEQHEQTQKELQQVRTALARLEDKAKRNKKRYNNALNVIGEFTENVDRSVVYFNNCYECGEPHLCYDDDPEADTMYAHGYCEHCEENISCDFELCKVKATCKRCEVTVCTRNCFNSAEQLCLFCFLTKCNVSDILCIQSLSKMFQINVPKDVVTTLVRMFSEGRKEKFRLEFNPVPFGRAKLPRGLQKKSLVTTKVPFVPLSEGDLILIEL